MTNRTVVAAIAGLALAALITGPACALKVYVQPSMQNSNHSPDGTYIEGYSMQDVANRLMTRLQAAGIDARCGGWMSVTGSINDAKAWGAECFIAVHTNAWPQKNGTAHGSQAFFYSHNGQEDPNSRDLARRCGEKMVEKFKAWQIGFDGGNYQNDWMEVCCDAPGVHALTEGLYHDNDKDLAVLRSDSGREAYAQALFEAICDQYKLPYGPTLYPMPTGPVGIDPDGKMEVFARGKKGQIYRCSQAELDGAFSKWVSMGATRASNPATARDADGRLEVFIRGINSQIYRKYQISPKGKWTAKWQSIGGKITSDVGVGMNLDGCLEIFARAKDSALWHCKQKTPNGKWGAWSKVIMGAILGTPAVARNADGRLAVFARDDSKQVVQCYQRKPGGDWSDWMSVGVAGAGDPVAANNADGRIEIACRGADNDLIDIWQTEINGATYKSASMGRKTFGQPSLARNGDGRLEIFMREAFATGVCDKNQAAQNGAWTDWTNLTGSLTGDLLSCRHANGKLALFCRGADGAMYTRSQTVNGGTWSDWSAMAPAVF